MNTNTPNPSGLRLRKATTGPRMNREQRRAFMRYLETPEGKAAVAKVQAEHVEHAKNEQQKGVSHAVETGNK